MTTYDVRLQHTKTAVIYITSITTETAHQFVTKLIELINQHLKTKILNDVLLTVSLQTGPSYNNVGIAKFYGKDLLSIFEERR